MKVKKPKQPDPIVDGITSGPVEPSFLLILEIWNAKNTHVQYWLESSLLISTAPSNKSKKVTRKLLLVVTTTEL